MSFWIKGTSTGPIAFSNTLATILGASSQSVATAVVNNDGISYTAGDILSVVGGTATIVAQIEVVSVDGSGNITDIRIFNAGSYTVNPTLTANAVTGGTGTGATIDLTMSNVGWVVDRNQVWDGGSEREVIAHGTGGGSDTIYVGWRTFRNVGSDYYNMELHGFTGFDSGLSHLSQPGASAGDHLAVAPQNEGCYLILTSAAFNWTINVNSFRIIISALVGGQAFHAYLGWGNRFGTATEYPYPLMISAPSAAHNVNSTLSPKVSSITDPWIAAVTTEEAGTVIYQPGGGWLKCLNRVGSTAQRTYCMTPTQSPTGASSSPSAPEDRFTQSTVIPFSEIVLSTSSGTTGGATVSVLQPRGSTYLLLPVIAVMSSPTPAVHLEVDECKWLVAFGGVASNDRFIDTDGKAWRVYQNGNRNDIYAFIAIKEAD